MQVLFLPCCFKTIKMKVQSQNKFSRSSKLQRVKETFLIIALVVYIIACSKPGKNNDPVAVGGGGGATTVDCSGAPKTFAADVKPVMQAICSGCHGAGSGNGPGALTTYTEIFNAKTAIRTAVVSGRMPQGGTLTAAQKAAIICWIDNGAPNN